MNSNLNNAAIIPQASAVFGLTPLKNVPDDYPVKAGFREYRMIVKGTEEGKVNAGKASQYCQLPDVTPGFATAFTNSDKGMGLVMDYIASLQNQAARQAYIKHGRSPCEADLSLESLFELGAAVSENVRLTKDTIKTWFDSKRNAIALQLTIARNEDATTNGFWDSEQGQKYLLLAGNWFKLFVQLAERRPAFTPEIKIKLETMMAMIADGTPFEEKMIEKLMGAVIPTADDLGI
jgi:hypothetical protein